MSATVMAATAVAAFPDFMAGGTSDATMYGDNHGPFEGKPWERQTKVHLYTQLVMSSILGLSAFLTFCVCVTSAPGRRPATTTWKLTNHCGRLYDQNGVNYMRRGGGSAMRRQGCPSCQKVFLDGYLLFGESRRRKSWNRRAWMPTW